MTLRAYFASAISSFLTQSEDEILGALVRPGGLSLEPTQRDAWIKQIGILKSVLPPYAARGKVYFEYSVPRLGKRIDVVLIIDHVLFILEFKVGEKSFNQSAIDQVFDYALDLKNFHETSHHIQIAPILVATNARDSHFTISTTNQNDGLLFPIQATTSQLKEVIQQTLTFSSSTPISYLAWENGGYQPTPTIVEAATALYRGHSVEDISRSDAGAKNLSRTSDAIAQIIRRAKEKSRKSICFVTGVPGAGKTLVGLNIATKHMDKEGELYSVFLSGNGPLVNILVEALARDKVERSHAAGTKIRKGEARSEVKMFVQNVHHFRDDCLIDDRKAPFEHVAIFDEAQRAWDLEQTSSFMRRKKGVLDFKQSEPEFLISCMDRHKDWAVVVCLVGGGQEINTGEAGIREWIESVLRSFHDWQIFMSSKLSDSEYSAASHIDALRSRDDVHFDDDLHLGMSLRSFRAENVSDLVKHLLDLDVIKAREAFRIISSRYPIAITRDTSKAKEWLRSKARGSERYGIVVSSQAQRLKPHAIDVRSPIDPIHWFLDGKEDVRSSFYLEDAATEFHVQGLELDWACVVWDADLRHSPDGWRHFSFVGSRWNRIVQESRKSYLKNAYRVLLTRARQGTVIVVPRGSDEDPTRAHAFYDPTFEYLRSIGIQEI